MKNYSVQVKIESLIAFNLSAESMEQALEMGKKNVVSLGNTLYAKGFMWMDGTHEVIGVMEND